MQDHADQGRTDQDRADRDRADRDRADRDRADRDRADRDRDHAELVRQLDGLPGPDDPWFPPRLNAVAFRSDDYRPQLRALAADREQPLLRRFRAFYGYLNILRRSLDITLYREFCERWIGDFTEFGMSELLRSQMYLNEVHNGRYSAELIKRALRHAEAARRRLPNHFGVESHWAGVVAEMQMRCPREQRDPELVRNALVAQERALIDSNEEYPQYFYIEAQLLYLLNRWDEAVTSVSRAIDRENSSLRDYPVRVGTYRSLRTEIELAHRIDVSVRESRAEVEKLRAEADDVRAETREIRSSTLTLVGLLGAVIAFLSSTTNIATKLAFGEAIRLMAVAAASIVVVFLSILAVVSPRRPRRSYLELLAVGSLAIVLCATVLLIYR